MADSLTVVDWARSDVRKRGSGSPAHSRRQRVRPQLLMVTTLLNAFVAAFATSDLADSLRYARKWCAMRPSV